MSWLAWCQSYPSIWVSLWSEDEEVSDWTGLKRNRFLLCTEAMGIFWCEGDEEQLVCFCRAALQIWGTLISCSTLGHHKEPNLETALWKWKYRRQWGQRGSHNHTDFNPVWKCAACSALRGNIDSPRWSVPGNRLNPAGESGFHDNPHLYDRAKSEGNVIPDM